MWTWWDATSAAVRPASQALNVTRHRQYKITVVITPAVMEANVSKVSTRSSVPVPWTSRGHCARTPLISAPALRARTVVSALTGPAATTVPV